MVRLEGFGGFVLSMGFVLHAIPIPLPHSPSPAWPDWRSSCDPEPVTELHPERAPLRLATVISGTLVLQTDVWTQVAWLIAVLLVAAWLALNEWRANPARGAGANRQRGLTMFGPRSAGTPDASARRRSASHSDFAAHSGPG